MASKHDNLSGAIEKLRREWNEAGARYKRAAADAKTPADKRVAEMGERMSFVFSRDLTEIAAGKEHPSDRRR